MTFYRILYWLLPLHNLPSTVTPFTSFPTQAMCLIWFAVVPFDQLVQLSSIRRLFGRPKRPFNHWRQQTTRTPSCTPFYPSVPILHPPAPSPTLLQVAALQQSTWMPPLTGDKAPQGCDCVWQDEAWLGLHCTGLWQQQQQQQQLHDVLIDTDNAHWDAHEDFVIHGAIQWAFSSMLRRYHQVVDPSQKTVREGSEKLRRKW